MMKKSYAFLLISAMVLMVSCNKGPQPTPQVDWSKYPDPSKEQDDGLMKPAACTYKVAAHRGGSSECGAPDNSIASLKYAMEVGCYASECDIYWTKDNNVVVAHADGGCRINGLYPWESTLAEIRAAGKLTNGEEVPCLEDFIKTVMVEGSCTRLWMDIKLVNYPSTNTAVTINAAKRACEIITELGAKHFAEFICTGNTTVMASASAYAKSADIAIGWMSNSQALAYAQKGYDWANLSCVSAMGPEAGGEGARSLDEFVKQGIALSVFNVDKQAGDGNAVYSQKAIDYYIKNYGSFKALCTNYPSWLLNTLEEAYKKYDGISSEEDLFAFVSAVEKDPEAKNFQNKEGEVVLQNNITVTKAWTPINGFTGVLDGNGKTITFNISSDATKLGLFSVLKGYVKNLTIAGKIESTNAKDEIQIGSFAGEISGGQMASCTNKAEISVAANESAERIVIMGGIAAKISEGANLTNCKNEGKISLKSEKSYFNIGGVIGVSAQDDKIITIKNCDNSGTMSLNTKYDSASGGKAWSYLGGIFGKPQTAGQYNLPTYHVTFEGCDFTGKLDVPAAGKTRAGGIVGYIKACTSVSNCTTSAAITVSGGAYDRCYGGIIGFQETSSDSYVLNCTFSGSIVAKDSNGNHYFGGITTTGMSTKTVIEACVATKDALVDITGANGKSVGMIAGRPNSAITIKNCKVAGKLVDKEGKATVITADNFADWMVKGSATTAEVVLQGNVYNK